VTPITQDTPTTNTLTLDPPSGPPLGGSDRCAGGCMSTTQPPPTSGGGKVIASQLPDIDWGLAPVPDVG